MGKIVSISMGKVQVGLDDGSLQEFGFEAFNYSPQVGDEVTIFRNNEKTVLTKNKRVAEGTSVGSVGNEYRKTFYLIAFILNWVTLGVWALFTFGIGLIMAAWVIPLNLNIWKIYKGQDNYKHTTLSVCTLIFINVISGILMLVAGGEDMPED